MYLVKLNNSSNMYTWFDWWLIDCLSEWVSDCFYCLFVCLLNICWVIIYEWFNWYTYNKAYTHAYTIYNIDIYPQHIYANIYNATREFYVSSRTEHNINNNNIQCIYILCVCCVISIQILWKTSRLKVQHKIIIIITYVSC